MEAKYFPYIYPQQEVLRRMAERVKAGDSAEPGTIVNIIGMGGKIASDIHIAGGAANAALMLATVGLAHYYARYGIRINAINPGATLTERVEEALKLEAGRQGVEWLKRWLAARPRCRSDAMPNRRKSPTSRCFWRAAARAM